MLSKELIGIFIRNAAEEIVLNELIYCLYLNANLMP